MLILKCKHMNKFVSQTQELQHISVLETWLYLPVWRNNSILVVSRYSRASPTPHATISLGARPLSTLVFHRQRQPVTTHPCAKNNGGCQHICITAYRNGTAHAQCICRHGYRIAGHGDCVREYLCYANFEIFSTKYMHNTFICISIIIYFHN